MKIDCGLIGRGFTDSTALKWVLGIPSTYDICQQRKISVTSTFQPLNSMLTPEICE